jgi:hypothetical protein
MERVCKTLFKSALSLKNEMPATDYPGHQPRRASIETWLDRLLKYSLLPDYKEFVSFQKRRA